MKIKWMTVDHKVDLGKNLSLSDHVQCLMLSFLNTGFGHAEILIRHIHLVIFQYKLCERVNKKYLWVTATS